MNMTKTSLLLGTVGALALCGPAQAEHFHGWYVGLEGGANWVQDDKFVDVQTGDVDDPVNNLKQSFSTGWAALGSVGYAFYNWRVEGEFGYRHNSLDKTKTLAGNLELTTTANSSGNLSEFTLMANVLYDIHLTDRFSLSLGAGAGGADARLKLGAFEDVGTEGEFIKDSHYSFAYQGIVGLNYYLGPRSTLFANYRYLDVTNPDFSVAGESAKFNDLRNHTVTLGLRFALSPGEEPVAAPPPPPPPPPTPPPPPPAVTHYIIFFGFNKCNITSEADGVLSQAASTAKSSGSAAISIVGHTDTVGSDKYNQKLSVCRANAAKSNLVGKGIPDGSITVTGRGESELMVQTGDNVKEPQNRRATIDLK